MQEREKRLSDCGVRESKLVRACSTETTKIVIMTNGIQRLGLGYCFFIVV